MAWVGEIVQGESTWGLIPSNLSIAGTRLGAICRFIQFGICDPTYSPFLLFPVTLGTDRDPHPTTPSQRNFLFLLLLHILSLSPGQSEPATFFPATACPTPRIATLFSRYLFPYHILAPFLRTNPTCMRLFSHVVLIIYTFSNSRLFFFSSQARLSS
jgi:hypothetical protein